MHAAAPAAATCVLLHGWHAALEMAPSDAEAVSARHGVQTVLPPAGRVVCVPAGHATQCACAKRAVKPPVVVPGRHGRHVLMFVALVTVEYVPLEQGVHIAAPVAPLCVPGAHAVHCDLSSPVNPTLHTHVFAVLPVSKFVAPAKQVVQAAAPRLILYLPGAHSAHVPPTAGSAPLLQAQSFALSLP